jgi:hypothetical protein
MLFFAALLYHAWVGMRDIVMDYLKPRIGLRLVTESAVACCFSSTWSGPPRSSGGAHDRSGTQVRRRDRGARAARACAPRSSSRRRASRSPVLSKVFPTRSHTVAAQGGVGASLGNMGEDQLDLAHVRHDQGIRLPRRPGRDRVHVPHGARGGDRARALRDALRPQRERHRVPAPVRRHSANFGEKPGAAQLLRRGPHRPRDAAHALPAQRARAHAVLRRVDGARPQSATTRATSSA